MTEPDCLDRALHARLEALAEAGLRRELREIEGPQAIRVSLAGRLLRNFSSNDYLGLANHPGVKEAALQAVERYGAGSGASRLICGSLAIHHRLEEALAAFKGTPAALVFSSGYATALGTIAALVRSEDVVIVDKLAHACLVDAARLSGAKLRVFAHNDLDDLERILRWADRRRTASSAPKHPDDPPRVLIVTESLFSMDGDVAPLSQIVELKERFGAWLLLDEAHATGLYGPRRRGLAEAFGIQDRVEIQMGTLGKTLGAAGGYVCGSRHLIDYLIHRARSFVFSTAPVPAASGAALGALEVVMADEGARRLDRLQRNVSLVRSGSVASQGCIKLLDSSLASIGWRRGLGRGGLFLLAPPLLDPLPTRPSRGEEEELDAALAVSDQPGSGQVDLRAAREVSESSPGAAASANPGVWGSAILPIIVGDERRTVDVATELQRAGFLLPAVRFPTVARNRARLRLTLTSEHTAEDCGALLQTLKTLWRDA
jgi:8-amino-7-oxononanoate synthase